MTHFLPVASLEDELAPKILLSSSVWLSQLPMTAKLTGGKALLPSLWSQILQVETKHP